MKARIGNGNNTNAASNLNIYASSSAKSIFGKAKNRNGASLNDNGASLVEVIKSDIDEANKREETSIDMDQIIEADALPPPPLSTPPTPSLNKNNNVSPSIGRDEVRKRADSGRELLLHALGGVNDDDVPPPPPPPPADDEDFPPPPPPPSDDNIDDGHQIPKNNEPRVVYPIANGFINETIRGSNPFESRSIEALSPEQASVIVDNSLFSPRSILRGAAQVSNLRVGDIVIVGTALRTGAAALAKFVDGLLHQDIYLLKTTTLVQRCRWIESKLSDIDVDMDPGFAPTTIANQNAPDGHRLFLSFFSSSTFESYLFSKIKRPAVQKPLSGVIPTPAANDLPKLPKFLVCVRNPIDVHLSYFRFVRRMYKQVKRGANTTKNFDDFFTADDFSRIDLPPVFAQSAGRNAAMEQHIDTYEHNLAKWIELYCEFPGNIQFVFYEDLVVKPQLVVNDIIQFLQLNPPMGQKEAVIEKFTKQDHEYPVGSKEIIVPDIIHDRTIRRRHGSCYKGHLKLLSFQILYMDYKWSKFIGTPIASSAMHTYEMFFNKIRGRPYPFPPRADAKIFDMQDVSIHAQFSLENLIEDVANKYPNSHAARKGSKKNRGTVAPSRGTVAPSRTGGTIVGGGNPNKDKEHENGEATAQPKRRGSRFGFFGLGSSGSSHSSSDNGGDTFSLTPNQKGNTGTTNKDSKMIVDSDDSDLEFEGF